MRKCTKMKLIELFEATGPAVKPEYKTILGTRVTFRNKKGGNSANIDVSKLIGYTIWRLNYPMGRDFFLIIKKTKRLSADDKFAVMKKENVRIDAFLNCIPEGRFIGGYSIREKIAPSAWNLFVSTDARVVIENSAFAELENTASVERPVVDTNNPEDAFFVLGYWINPSSRGDNEYFWAGAFAERGDALAWAGNKQKRGQPRNFIDWVKGQNTIYRGVDAFSAAAKKVGINPNLNDLDFM